ncbi:CRP-like cAMP-binding protein [Nitrobacteraceae bacterium AZCC 2161]
MEEGKHVRLVYFPTNAVISLVVALQNGRVVESAMVGQDGVLAASPALDSRLSLSRAVVQLAGYSLVCEAARFKKAVLESSTLLSAIMRHEQTLFAQSQQPTACVSAHTIASRICRFLLRARDLCEEDELPITQKFLAELMGVRRTSITDSAVAIQTARLIDYRRGMIRISDVAALQEASCGYYVTVRSHYSALLRIKHDEEP